MPSAPCAACPPCCDAWRARLTRELLDPRVYGHDAMTLAPIYRMAALTRSRRRYDVLHAHFGPLADRFRFARRLFGAPYVASFHGYDFSSWPQARGEGAYRGLFAEADAVTIVSGHARDRLQALGCPADKIHPLPMGVEMAELPFRERRPRPGAPLRILTVARLVEKKGLDHSIRAFAAARRKVAGLHYDIVGEGPLKGRLAALARELGLGDAVTFHGPLDSAATIRMMDEADLFVLASVTAANGDQEGAPVVLMEAQACGLPVVSTWHSGIPEVVPDGGSGLLVPERDADALAQALLELLRRPETWPEMGRRGRAHIEESYDSRKLSERQVQLYRALRGEPASP
jgi:colanic acid/amylovoran biosynthesis glycosyltransferase